MRPNILIYDYVSRCINNNRKQAVKVALRCLIKVRTFRECLARKKCIINHCVVRCYWLYYSHSVNNHVPSRKSNILCNNIQLFCSALWLHTHNETATLFIVVDTRLAAHICGIPLSSFLWSTIFEEEMKTLVRNLLGHSRKCFCVETVPNKALMWAA